ncbi:phosphatase PAP2 family protein [Sphingomonas sp. SUN019]|uniref:phosphatase PAP2 family protein n=1 Tax=Sphingomonas sp. SUN019 TaxID=2937788 RepID=UPI0021642469|nr:phosphatase PAP2 family protein [Sphingomonas sp. SUN019]UVO50520.1 phosphatase PAP2 family protein [Sphingomonas sp. SUN019]
MDHEEATPAGVARPPHLLWAAGIGAVAIALMLLLGFVIDRWPFAFDQRIIIGVHGAGPPWVRKSMIDITALGGGTVLTMVTVATAALLLLRRLWITALLMVIATISGSTIVQALKVEFARARPDIVDHIVVASGNSFPSGHAANSAIVYLTIAGLLSQVVRGRSTRNFVIAVAVLLVGAIGMSRVYLGVHWPSDVLAGWSFGTLWALAWWWAAAKTRAATIHRQD